MTLPILILAFAQALLTGEPKLGGTFIGVIICSDGIIIGADSRSTFLDGGGRPIGYIDGMAKVFVQQGTAFAAAGLTTIEGELFNAFVRRNDFLLARPADEVLYGVSLRLPVRNTAHVLLLSAGFVDGQATICGKEPTTPQVCQKIGVITSKPSPSLRRWQETLKTLPKAQDAAVALRQAILESSAGDPTVGGPVLILQLQKEGVPVWIENGTQENNWIEVCDIVNDHRRNKTTIRFTNSQDELDHFLSAVCPAK